MCVYVCVCGKGLLTRVALVTRLQPEGNMIKDRIYSMVRRNMLEHRERTKRYVMGAVCVCVCFACVCVCVFARARVCACVPLPLATHFSVFMLTLLASLPCVGTGAGTTRRKSIRIGLTRTLSTGTCWWWWWCKEIVATSIRRSLTRCCRVPNASDTHTRMLLGFVFVFCFCFFAAAVCDVLIRACSFDQRLSKLGL